MTSVKRWQRLDTEEKVFSFRSLDWKDLKETGRVWLISVFTADTNKSYNVPRKQNQSVMWWKCHFEKSYHNQIFLTSPFPYSTVIQLNQACHQRLTDSKFSFCSRHYYSSLQQHHSRLRPVLYTRQSSTSPSLKLTFSLIRLIRGISQRQRE